MKRRSIIIFLVLSWWAFEIRAQVPEENASIPENWQMSLDSIKSKAQSLMVENSGLKIEYRRLTDQVQQLQQEVYLQQNKNEQMSRFLKVRKGHTDQQLRIEELNRMIMAKKKLVRDTDKQFSQLNENEQGIQRKIQQLKLAIANIELHQTNGQQKNKVSGIKDPADDDGELAPWRKQLEDANKNEALLENEIQGLKEAAKPKDFNADKVDQQNRELEDRLNVLKLQKLQYLKGSSEARIAQANALKFDQLRKRKEELEININAYEFRLDQLKDSSAMSMSWPLKKKKLVHALVEADTRNSQMRSKIKVLREDIGILRDQVAKMERRLNFVKGQVN